MKEERLHLTPQKHKQLKRILWKIICQQTEHSGRKGQDKFLETHKQTTLKQEEIENLNSPITSNEIELVIIKLTRNKNPGPGGFPGEL